MQIRITYSIYQCRVWHYDCDECPYVDKMEEGYIRDACEDFEEEFPPDGAAPERWRSDLCRYLDIMQKTEVKQVKTFELLKDWQSGYVKIGRKTYQLRDVSLLQVDYGDGNGMITEWKNDDDVSDNIYRNENEETEEERKQKLMELLKFKPPR